MINSMERQVIICKDIVTEIDAFLASRQYDKLYVLTDTHTCEACFPLIQHHPAIRQATLITIEAGDTHKDIEQVILVWEALSKNGASRNSLLINLGGGMITDLGGFAGATFKRGLHTLNIPTTLMASVDAAVGGKTGFNFNGLKNEIGAFYMPDAVLIDCTFLCTLDRDNLLSGYAEMIKHGLISTPEAFARVLAFDLESQTPDMKALSLLVEESVAVKERIVAEDPKEKGIRKALNLGHTVGHACESLSFARQRPVLHGHAVAAGLICELYLSYQCSGLPVGILRQTTNFIKANYPLFAFSCNDYETLYELMTHDKKNEGGIINFTLLKQIGDVQINCPVDKKIIFEALDFYCDTTF
ncbi:MAG: 3-dehydroquinate synthase [Tannerella sp.]|nr:3-dehydroquinate synthase [Tannerella sp.]